MFTRILKYSLKNILRNKFLSISSVLVLTLLMFFINILLVLHNVSFKLIDSINSKLSISLYLKDGYDKNSLEVIDFMKEIGGVSNTINATYKTKEELLEELKEKDPKLVGILEKENPLPNTIIVGNIGLDEYGLLNNTIEKRLYLLDDGNKGDKNQNFANYKAQYDRIEKVISILDALRIGLYVIIGIFLLSISVIVYSVIGNFIYYYRDEIYITKLVGGNNVFIYGPFSLQGIIYSLISFIFSTIFFLLLLNNINFIFSFNNSFDFLFNNFYIIFLIELVIFTIIGALSGYFSSKKYINN
nr:hypothetical protein [Candidatus Gracilibacteria bacterium]